MHKILAIVGSGIKNGNTDKLADAYRKGAEANGHVIHKVFLGDKKIVGCQGCDAKDISIMQSMRYDSIGITSLLLVFFSKHKSIY